MLDIPKPRLSVCLIVQDEAEHITGCLASVKPLASEIIVVDTGSRDATVRLAAQAGARIHHFSWSGEFAPARNFALEQATGNWILVIDADETLAPVGENLFKELLAAPDVEGYFVNIKNYVNSGDQISWDKVVRLFRRNPSYRFRGAIHEQIAPAILEVNHGQGLAVAPLTINHCGYLDSLLQKKQKHRRNVRIIKQALTRYSPDPFLWYCLGLEYYGQTQIPAGLACLETALSQLQGNEGFGESVLVNLTLGYFQTGQTEKLLRLASGYQTIFPRQPILYLIYSIASLQSGRYREAAESLRQAAVTSALKHLPDGAAYFQLVASELDLISTLIEKQLIDCHIPLQSIFASLRLCLLLPFAQYTQT